VKGRTIEQVRDFDLEEEVKKLYSPSLPYHNFQHVIDTITAAEKIIQRCNTEGIRVDGQVVYLALLFHDAAYHENHEQLGFESKERYSADLAVECLLRRGMLSKTAAKVAESILSTHRNASFITAEQKTVRAADLSGLAAEYAIFRANTEALRQERELFSGKPVSWDDWVIEAVETIRFYLSQEIRLTSYFINEHGESAFHQAVRKNLERLIDESASG
jgi:predicted metal-dependent HD superfamily phosphohydrolase